MDSMHTDRQELLRHLPQVNELAELAAIDYLPPDTPRSVLLEAVRSVVAECRNAILDTGTAPPSPSDLELRTLIPRVILRVEESQEPNLRRVINATGVVLHTNLGRSPLCSAALEAIGSCSSGYCNLEYRLADGQRGSRQEHMEDLITFLTGAEAAMVVNNNAAAVLLVLSALACNGEVVVSRGELVEIGDSFRLPDIMAHSGARLVEVGTTNRTTVADYSAAVGPETSLLMKIHPSNYRIVGYCEDVSLKDLALLGRKHSIPVVEDLGSGSLVDLGPWGLKGEHTVTESILSGADLVTMSGDKLLGGPQCGIITGSAPCVSALKSHPLARAVRLDKISVAALEATLREYLQPTTALKSIPALRMLTEAAESVRRRAQRLKRRLGRDTTSRLQVEIVQETSRAGGGSLPVEGIPTCCLALSHPELDHRAIEERLRKLDPPVIGRLKNDVLLLDMRTVSDEEVMLLSSLLSTLD